jgi:hypothetical protein
MMKKNIAVPILKIECTDQPIHQADFSFAMLKI